MSYLQPQEWLWRAYENDRVSEENKETVEQQNVVGLQLDGHEDGKNSEINVRRLKKRMENV